MFNIKISEIMKKIILALAAVALSAGMVFAQDMATATEKAKEGNEALQNGDKAAALASFQEALQMAESCGEAGNELASTCKSVIPGIILSIGKEAYNEHDFDSAIARFNEAAKIAEEYGDDATIAEVAELLPQANINKELVPANDAFKAKDFETAAAGFRKVLELDGENGVAAFRLVQSLANLGDLAGAKEAFAKAEANGQGGNAAKVLGGSYLKQAAADLKAKNYAAAVENALEANNFQENAQAFLVAGQASQKLNKNDDAIKYFEQYLEAAPTAKNANAIIFTVGALYQGAGNKAKAIENYKKVLSDPQFGANAKQMIDALSK